MKLQDEVRQRNAFVNIFNTLSNALLPLVTFASYVYMGGTLTVASTSITYSMIGKIKGPINELLNIQTAYVDIQKSLERIHEFLMSEESQKNFYLHVMPKEKSDRLQDGQDEAEKMKKESTEMEKTET